jgi:hypothetical protein
MRSGIECINIFKDNFKNVKGCNKYYGIMCVTLIHYIIH